MSRSPTATERDERDNIPHQTATIMSMVTKVMPGSRGDRWLTFPRVESMPVSLLGVWPGCYTHSPDPVGTIKAL